MAKKKTTRSRKSALTKAEKFYIDHHSDLTDKELADTFMSTIKAVQDYRQDKSSEVKTPKYMEQIMGRKTRNNKPVAAIMTPAASEFADEIKDNGRKSKDNSSFIHKPKG
jgi:hypothetical protein